MPYLTINVAAPGAPLTDGSSSAVGHMWYSINEGDGSQAESFGFAPASSDSPLGAGKVSTGDNTEYLGAGQTPYYTQTVEISQAQYDTLKAFGESGVNVTSNNGGGDILGGNGVDFNSYYNGLNNSCIDFTWAALETIGIEGPSYVPGTEVLPIWNPSAINSALTDFQETGGTETVAPIDTQGPDGNIATRVIEDDDGNVITTTTYTYGYNEDLGTYSVTADTKNAAGEVIETDIQSFNPSNGAGSDDSVIYEGGTGAQLSEQQVSSDSSNNITDNVSGTGATANFNNASIALAAGTQAAVAGANNAITVAADAALTLSGSGNSATVTASGTSITLADSAVAGNTNTITPGSAEDISILASLSPSAGSNTISVASGQQTTITGTDGTLTANNNATDSGIQNTINWNAGGSELQNITVTDGGFDEDDVGYTGSDGSGTETYEQAIVQSDGSTSATISGSGDISGLSNAAITFDDDATATLLGGTNTISLGNDDNLTLNAGASNAVTLSGDDSTITDNVIDSSNSLSVTGADNTINLDGTGDSATIGGASNAINMSGDNASLAGDVTNLSDGSQEITFADSNAVTIGDGQQVTITGSDGTLTANNDATDSGVINTTNWTAGGSEVSSFSTSGSTSTEDDIGYTGSNGSGTETYEQIVTQSDGATSATISGSGDVSGLSNTAITLDDGATASIIGSGNTITVGDDDTLNLSEGTTNTLVLSGDGSTIDNSGTGNTITVSGSSDTVDISGTDAALEYNNVTLGDSGEQITFSGDNTVTVASGDESTVIGADGTLTADNSGATPQNTIDFTAGGSQIASFNSDGSSVADNYTGSDGSGTLTEIDVNGGTYDISGTVTANVFANDASTVVLNNGTDLSGDTLGTDGTGSFEVGSGQTATLDGVTIAIGTMLTTLNDSQTDLAGTIINDGFVELDSTGSGTELLTSGSNATLGGSGVIDLNSNTALSGLSDIYTLTLGADQITEGSGTIGNEGLVDNEGTIDANESSPLTVLNMDNNGTIEATAGSTLDIGTTNNYSLIEANGGTVDVNGGIGQQDGGVITAEDGSTIALVNSGYIVDGTLNGSGSFETASGQSVILDGVTIASGTTFTGENNSTTYLEDTITNDGTVALDSTGSGTQFVASGGNVTIDGTGTIDLDSNTALSGVSNVDVLTLGADQTTEGSGTIGNEGLVDNEGTIIANQSSPLTVLNMDNNGTIEAGTGGILDIGTTNNYSLIEADGGTVDVNGGIGQQDGGVITADDGSTVALVNSGYVVQGTLNGTGSFETASGQSATLDGVTIASGTTLTGETGSTTYLEDTITNDGTIALDSTGSGTQFVASTSAVTIDGTGTINLGSNTALSGVSNYEVLTLGADQTTEGSGTIGNEGLVNNEGTIIANSSSSLTVLNMDNNGTIEAGSGGILDIGTTNNYSTIEADGGTVDVNGGIGQQDGGIITAEDGSTVALVNGADILDGTLNSEGSGAFQTASGQSGLLDGVTIASGTTFTGLNNSTTSLADDITNDGTLALTSTGSGTQFVASSSDATIGGTGTIDLSSNTALSGVSNYEVLTLGVDQTTEGSGTIGNEGLVNNEGTIIADSSSPLTVLNMDNNGTIVADSGGTLNIGTTNNYSTIEADGGTVNVNGGIGQQDGGTINAISDSTVALVNGADIIDGTLTADTGGTFQTDSGQSGLLDGVTITSGTAFTGLNGSTTDLADSVTNNGTITLDSTGGDTELMASSSNATIGGTGTINLTSGTDLTGFSDINTLTLGSDQTVEGTGSIGNDGLVDNDGTIIADSSSALSITNMNNYGTIESDAGGSLDIGTANNYGTIASNGGTIDVTTGITNDGTIENNDGSIDIDAGVTNNGTLEATDGNIIYVNGDISGDGTIAASGTSSAVVIDTSGSVGGSETMSADDGADIYFEHTFITVDTSFGDGSSCYASGDDEDDGDIDLGDDDGDDGDPIFQAVGDTTLSGTGMIYMGSATENYVYGPTGSGETLTIESGFTVEGTGLITDSGLGTIDNEGTFIADHSEALNVGAGVTNDGTITAITGGALNIGGSTLVNDNIIEANGGAVTVNGAITQSNDGVIEALAGSSVSIVNGANISGGTLSTTGTGTLQTTSGQSATLDGVTIASGATFAGEDASTTTLSDMITNDGTLQLNSSDDNTELLISGDVTLNGTGTVLLGDSSDNIITGTTTGDTLTNDNTISGAGQIGLGDGDLTLMNDTSGVIDATGTSNELVIDTGDNAISNSGLIEATGSAGLTINSTVTNNSSGTIEADGGKLTINNDVADSGNLIANGSSLDITGNVTGGGTATLSGTSAYLEFGGSSADNIVFNSGATGTLKLDYAEGFSGTVAGMTDDDSIDLGDFLYSGTPTISGVSGSGDVGTTTNVTITDGAISTTLALLNQYANQFAVSSSAYSLTADSAATNQGTLLQLAAGH